MVLNKNNFVIGLGMFLAASFAAPAMASDITYYNMGSSDNTISSWTIKQKQNNYEQIKESIEQDRLEFKRQIDAASSEEEKNAIVVNAQEYLAKALISEVAPAWYGTYHDYNGAVDKPGGGDTVKESIACGYFVATVLAHMGFRLDRKDLGRQNSPWLIRSVSHPIKTETYWRESHYKVVEDIIEEGPGVYVVGMDKHIGFIVYDGEKTAFVHSYKHVRSQRMSERSLFSISKWVKVGKTFGFKMTADWIHGREVKVYMDPEEHLKN